MDAQTVDQAEAHPGHGFGQFHLGQQVAGGLNFGAGQGRLGGVLGHHAAGVGAIGLGAAVGFQALLGVGQPAHQHPQPKAVQNLGPQAALFGVHGADEHEARAVGGREGSAAHGVMALGGSVEDGVDHLGGEQVDLVHIEQVAVRLGQDAFAQAKTALGRGPLVQPAHHILQPRVEGQFNEPHPVYHGQGFALLILAGAVGAHGLQPPGLDVLGQAAVVAQAARHLGQQVDQPAHRRGLGRPPRADEQHPAHGRVDEGQQQAQFHFLLTHDGQEGEGHLSGVSGVLLHLGLEGPTGDDVDEFLEGTHRARRDEVRGRG